MSNDLLFDEETVTGIVGHMNDDHTDALVLYIKAFAGLEADEGTTSMTSIDAHGIDLTCKVNDQEKAIRITFSETGITDALNSRAEARSVLVDMVKIARAN